MLSGFMAESKGFFRRTPVHLRVASLLDHVGKNSPPDCFLPQTSLLPPCSNPLYLFLPMQKAGLATCFSFWQITLILIETILWGCNFGSEGGAFSMLGGCSSRFEGVHYSTREDSNEPQVLKPAVFSFLLGLNLDFCAALEFEFHPSVSVGRYRVNDCQPELFVKLGENVQFLHLEHESSDGICLGFPCCLCGSELLKLCLDFSSYLRKAFTFHNNGGT